jgi:hypothetical protein
MNLFQATGQASAASKENIQHFRSQNMKFLDRYLFLGVIFAFLNPDPDP